MTSTAVMHSRLASEWDAASAAHLLRRDEEVPKAVARVAEFLTRRGVWFVLSRNGEAHSCRDAAGKRWRVGHEGIPLCDELKSFFGHVLPGPSGVPSYVAAHYRGDRSLATDRLASVLRLDAPPSRLEPDRLQRLGMGYGLVNPFEPWSGQPLASGVLQVFDRDLLVPSGEPGTVMTNAGDRTWAVEFVAEELVRALGDVLVADIACNELRESASPRSRLRTDRHPGLKCA